MKEQYQRPEFEIEWEGEEDIITLSVFDEGVGEEGDE